MPVLQPPADSHGSHPRNPWTSCGPLSLGCSKQDFAHQPILGYSVHVAEISKPGSL